MAQKVGYKALKMLLKTLKMLTYDNESIADPVLITYLKILQ